MLTQSLQKGKTSKMWWSQFSVLVAAGLSPCCPASRKTGACKNTIFLRKDQTKQSAEIDHTLQKLIFHVQKGDQSLPDIIFVIIIATIMNTTNKIKSITTHRKVMLDGVGEEESLVATGGAADHLAVVYNTDDQVIFFMMTMAWCDDGHWGPCCSPCCCLCNMIRWNNWPMIGLFDDLKWWFKRLWHIASDLKVAQLANYFLRVKDRTDKC